MPICRLNQIDLLHDHNTLKFIECIRTAHNICGSDNLIAIKVTALVRPNVLRKFNTILKSIEDRSSLPSLFELINQNQTNTKISSLFQPFIDVNAVESKVIECTLSLSIDTSL